MRSVRTADGRGSFKWRKLVCLPMIVILPASLWADDTAAAILRTSGGVLVNKNPAQASTALFPDDLIETPDKVAARIEAAGSTADINPQTVLQFEGNELVLDHGSLSVNTSRGLRVRVGCVLITPVNDDWTHYDVTDLDGKVTVSALKNGVNIDSRSTNARSARQGAHSDRVTVREGETKSREEKCGAPIEKDSREFAGRGAFLNSPWAKGAGMVGVGVLACWALCRGDDPISPAKPN